MKRRGNATGLFGRATSERHRRLEEGTCNIEGIEQKAPSNWVRKEKISRGKSKIKGREGSNRESSGESGRGRKKRVKERAPLNWTRKKKSSRIK